MARFLVYTSPARGHLYPLVPTLEELGRRGHDVVVRTLASEVELVRGLGFSARAMNPAIERREMDDWREGKPLAALQRGLRTFLDRAPHEVPDLRKAIDEERPDALFVDVNCWGAAAAAEAWGGPWAYFTPYLLPVPSRDAPPFGPGLPPLKVPAGKLRDGLVRRIANRSVDSLLPHLNSLRSDLGLPRVRHVAHLPLTAPLIVSYTAEPFEYPRSDWPESVRMVGPGIWDPPPGGPPGSTTRAKGRSSSSRYRPSSRTTPGSWRWPSRRSRTRTHASSPPRPPWTPRASSPRPTPASSASCRTSTSWSALLASSATGAWASPRRPSPKGYPCAPCRSDATSSRLPGASRSRAPGAGFPPLGCGRIASGAPCAKP